MGTARRLPGSRTWLRVVVLLFAVLLPGTHAQAHSQHLVVGAPAEVAEHDLLDASLRAPARTGRRGVVRVAVRPRSGPPPAASRRVPVSRRACAPPREPYLPPVPRTVVLRC
ncbi:hypothetical protein SZN_29013 [Streptomyces zinciresistens K42]|uniref:Uncharacterized protein n=1 Tax=Streptomyces zinciresistens K42 TaxID=700597 RepID=G2GJW0_9ACTN|nr:hypothetical protein [Streptomyces zinciresistens]EGX56226.1 hypothetical protein SZN_29013 [Streptomyces zinciresistens K42]